MVNNKIDREIRDSIVWLKENNIKLRQGAWFTLSSGKITEADFLGAVLLKNKLIATENLDDKQLSSPGFIKCICEFLNVDISWLRRFWLGADRNYQVIIIGDSERKISDQKDHISAYAISLAKNYMERQDY